MDPRFRGDGSVSRRGDNNGRGDGNRRRNGSRCENDSYATSFSAMAGPISIPRPIP